MIDLHNEIKKKEAVDNWREYMIYFLSITIIKYYEVHIEKTECIHELLPCSWGLYLFNFFVESLACWCDYIKSRLFVSQSIMDEFLSHLETLLLGELTHELTNLLEKLAFVLEFRLLLVPHHRGIDLGWGLRWFHSNIIEFLWINIF